MNILIVTQYFWPEEFRINDIALGLKEKNHNITVLTGIPNYPKGRFYPGYSIFRKRREDYRGVKVIRVPLVPRGKSGPVRLAMNYLSFAISACIFGPFYCREKYDAILVYQLSPATACLPAILLKRFRPAPMILWVQDLWPESLSATGAVRSKKILGILEIMMRYIYSNSDKILIQSQAFLQSIVKMGVAEDKILYFPNSVEDVYRPVKSDSDAPENIGLPSGFRIMFAGNIGAAQDFGTILSASEKLKDYTDIHWLVFGDGRMRSWVEDQINKRGLSKNIHILGRFPTDRMPDFFSAADVMLVTLKKEPIFSFTIPSKVQSYLACEKPIIAALEGEGARVVSDAGAGLTCKAEDPDGLADAVLEAYRMQKGELREMGRKGKKYFDEHFSRIALIDKLEDLIRKEAAMQS